MRKKISGMNKMFGMLLLILVMVVLAGGVVRAGDVENIGGNDDTSGHTHEWTYEKVGETIKAKCSDETCKFHTPGISFTLSITTNNEEVSESNPIYENMKYEVTVDVEEEITEDTEILGEIEKIKEGIVYSYKNEDSQEDLKSKAPETKGNYSVTAQFGGNAEKNITKLFEIKHSHKWEYTKVGEGIQAKCSDEACKYHMPGISFTLSITTNNEEVSESNPIYENMKYEVTVDVEEEITEDTEILGEIEKIKEGIVYSYKNEDSQEDLKNKAPETKGNYSVTAQFGGNAEKNITKLFEIKHSHKWEYTKVGEGIQATCSDVTCEYHMSGVSITLNTGELTCDGYKGASVTNIEKLELKDEPSIVYLDDQKQETTQKDGADTVGGIPKNVGEYYATIEFAGKNNTVTLEKFFNIQHDYNITIEWENTTPKIKEITCTKNSNHIISPEDIDIKFNTSDTETEPATCVSEGVKKYTTTAIVDSKTFTSETTVNIPKDSQNHVGEDELRGKKTATCVEEGYTGDTVCKSCNGTKKTGERIQRNPKNHVGGTEKRDAKAATCEEAGNEGDIYCKGCNSKISDGAKIPALGHNYGAVRYEWSGTNNAKAVLTCQNDSRHTQSYQLAISSKEQKATCDKEGKITYTANATIGGKEYKDTKVVTTKAKGYKWNKGKITKKSTDKAEGVYTYTCTNGCKHTKKDIIPRKSITVELGKKTNIISKASACQKMKLANASKYKKYLTFNTKTGEIKTKKYYKVKINKSIPVKVTIGGKNYTVPIKIKIPAPKVKITKKAKRDSYGKYYRYTFKYNIKGADKIQVRVENAKKTGKEKTLNKTLDKYLKKSKSNKSSYVEFSTAAMKKLKNKNNKVTFKIIAYYGKNKSETLIIKK